MTNYEAMSHPSRVRGLKFRWVTASSSLHHLSHPSRVRGLKSSPVKDDASEVAIVAPFTGAWIEILQCRERGSPWHVAPFTGAWIEMSMISFIVTAFVMSHPSRVRGLK